MMTRTVGVALATLLATFLPQFSGAATVSVGSYTFDDSDFATSLSLAIDNSPNSSNLGNASDGDLGTFAKIGASVTASDVATFGFSRPVENGSGTDLLFFSLSQIPAISLSSTTGFQTLPIDAASSQPNSAVNVFTLDLSDLGVAAGTTYTGSLFLKPSSNATLILVDMANISTAGASGGGPSAVPLHGGVVFLLTCLGALGVVARRRQAGKAKSP